MKKEYRKYYQVLKYVPGFYDKGIIFPKDGSLYFGPRIRTREGVETVRFTYAYDWLELEGYIKRVYIHSRKK